MCRNHRFAQPPEVPRDGEALAQARRESTNALIEVVHRGEETRRIASTFHTMRRNNGFEALIERSMGPR